MRILATLAVSLFALTAPAFAAHHEAGGMHHHGVSTDAVAEAVASTDRAEWELERDPGRRPDLVLAHADIEPGDRVADLGAGGGYFTHLVAHLVGPDGSVIGQNPQAWEDNYGGNWPLQHGSITASHSNVSFVISELDALGFEPGSLDAITMALIYHDVALMDVDRAVMAASLYEALTPGGSLLITDHHTPDGGDYRANADDLHRGNEAVTTAEMEAAGFELVGSYTDLANDDDDMTLNVFHPDIRGQTSRFILVFRKPE